MASNYVRNVKKTVTNTGGKVNVGGNVTQADIRKAINQVVKTANSGGYAQELEKRLREARRQAQARLTAQKKRSTTGWKKRS